MRQSFVIFVFEEAELMNEQTAFWLLLAVVLGVIESCTVSLVTIWPAAAAVVAAFTAAFGAGEGVQGAVFVVVSGILLVLTRPLARKFVRRKAVSTNADRIIGAEGIVTERIDPVGAVGQVKVMGQIWSAKSETGEPIESGKCVTVSALEGVRAVVREK